MEINLLKKEIKRKISITLKYSLCNSVKKYWKAHKSKL
jgi:hypothetical protein